MKKTIIINESQLHLIQEYENKEILPGDFDVAVRGYLEELRKNPTNPKYNDFFKENNIAEKDLQNKLMKLGVIERVKEGFKEPEDANGKKHSVHFKKFKFFGKDFENNLDKLYDAYFTKDYKRKSNINEDEMGGGANGCCNLAVGTSDPTMGTIKGGVFGNTKKTSMIRKPKYNSSRKGKTEPNIDMDPAMETHPGFASERLK